LVRRPSLCVSAAFRFLRSLGLSLFRREQRLAAKPNLARWIDVDHFDHHLIPFLQLVAHVFDAIVRDLGDMEQAVEARHDLDEGAEIGNPLDFADVGLIQFRRGGQFLNDANRLGRRGFVGRSDVDAAVILDIDLHAGPLDDAANHLAARTDDVADLIDRDTDGDDPRRVT
jgi:hypothetical protein